MFLKGLKDKFKLKSGRKFLKNALDNPLSVESRKQGITSVGILVDLDRFDNSEVFYQFVEDFRLRPNAIKIMGYKSYYDKNSPYATPVFSDKDLGWNGEVENSYALEFLGKEYDMLVNYFNEENFMLHLMSVRTRARIKVGFAEVDDRLNDLILETPIEDFKTFKRELKKYLKVFSEIEV
ncbi:DUF6913 domain-containing protein [Eudoraea chungangensis]|uniref:DUF6913 domain-containing protein n=1 Tax=Eudoraea chungangensis TaxID=1481905 RepID=UPI0023EB3600|nr:hypothetical protein [Eudoraea chungangensis]